jgi:hypothetical protein
MENVFMTLDQAESILAAYASGMFYGTRSELVHAQLLVDAAIKKEQEEINNEN